MFRISLVLVLLFLSTAAYAEEPACDEPVLWLTTFGVDAMAAPYCAKCLPKRDSDWCEEAVTERARRYWNALAVRTPKYISSCTETDYAIQVVRAWHGRGLDDTTWQPVFEARAPWFGERARASYPKPTPAMLRQLKAKRRHCVARQKAVRRIVAAARRVERRGKFDRPIVSHRFGKSGITAEYLGPSLGRRHGWRYEVHEAPSALDGWMAASQQNQTWQPIPDEAMEQGIHARLDLYAGPGHTATHGFTCFDECEGGESYTLYLDADGNVVAQMREQSACPFVYTRPDATVPWLYGGEIIRNLNRETLEGAQTLDIGRERAACQAGAVEVRIAEEKDETTYLDAIALEVDGHAIPPAACAGSDSGYCTEDGVYYVLERGDAVDLRFEIPPNLRDRCAQGLRLWADGYYVPHD